MLVGNRAERDRLIWAVIDRPYMCTHEENQLRADRAVVDCTYKGECVGAVCDRSNQATARIKNLRIVRS